MKKPHRVNWVSNSKESRRILFFFLDKNGHPISGLSEQGIVNYLRSLPPYQTIEWPSDFPELYDRSELDKNRHLISLDCPICGYGALTPLKQDDMNYWKCEACYKKFTCWTSIYHIEDVEIREVDRFTDFLKEQ